MLTLYAFICDAKFTTSTNGRKWLFGDRYVRRTATQQVTAWTNICHSICITGWLTSTKQVGGIRSHQLADGRRRVARTRRPAFQSTRVPRVAGLGVYLHQRTMYYCFRRALTGCAFNSLHQIVCLHEAYHAVAYRDFDSSSEPSRHTHFSLPPQVSTMATKPQQPKGWGHLRIECNHRGHESPRFGLFGLPIALACLT